MTLMKSNVYKCYMSTASYSAGPIGLTPQFQLRRVSECYYAYIGQMDRGPVLLGYLRSPVSHGTVAVP
jgi:hypothetical protein